MTKEIEVINLSEAAFLLRARLGPMRAWRDFLMDCERGKQSIHGLVVLPVARMQTSRGFKPVFDLAEVYEFIEAVKRIESVKNPAKIIKTVAHIDTAKLWKVNKIDKAGYPIAHLHSYFVNCAARPVAGVTWADRNRPHAAESRRNERLGSIPSFNH